MQDADSQSKGIKRKNDSEDDQNSPKKLCENGNDHATNVSNVEKTNGHETAAEENHTKTVEEIQNVDSEAVVSQETKTDDAVNCDQVPSTTEETKVENVTDTNATEPQIESENNTETSLPIEELKNSNSDAVLDNEIVKVPSTEEPATVPEVTPNQP